MERLITFIIVMCMVALAAYAERLKADIIYTDTINIHNNPVASPSDTTYDYTTGVWPNRRIAGAIFLTPSLKKDVFRGCNPVKQMCEIPKTLTGGNLTHTLN